MGIWGVVQAKARFSEVIEKAMTEGPKEITKGGKDAVVIVWKGEWMERAEPQNAKPRQNMAEVLLNSPLRGSGLKIGRLKLKPGKSRSRCT